MNAPRKDAGKRLEEFSAIWIKHIGKLSPVTTASEALEQGAALLMVKQITPHGSWRNKVNQLGLEASTSSRLMACARRFKDAPPTFLAAVGSFSKLYELLALSHGFCDELSDGKPVGRLTWETLSGMTCLELREEVRAVNDAASKNPGSEPVPRALKCLFNPPRSTVLTVEEERMLRLFRQANEKTREALFLVAELQARS
jgi:hypothetical protein